MHRDRPDSLYKYGIVYMIAWEDHWRSADGEPRDNDQLDDSYSILKPTNFPFPDVLGDMRSRQYATNANSRVPLQDLRRPFFSYLVIGKGQRATHRALRDRRAPLPSSSRECCHLKDLHVWQTLRQKMEMTTRAESSWVNRCLRKEEKKKAKRGTMSVLQATDTEKATCRAAGRPAAEEKNRQCFWVNIVPVVPESWVGPCWFFYVRVVSPV